MTYRKNINNKTMKEINTKIVLNTIRQESRISRKDIATKTNLTTGTVTNIVGDLLYKSLLLEVGNAESEGGRKPVLLELNAKVGYAIGVSLETACICCVISDYKANVLYRRKHGIDVKYGREKLISSMIGFIEKAIEEAHIGIEKIIGIGLAVPGPCNYEKGIMINPPNFPDWNNVPIVDIISDHFDVPVYMSKETSCYVLSEYWFKAPADRQRIFGLNIGDVGIGGAFISSDGRIYQEQGGESMDIGHVTVNSEGEPCGCGSVGCLESQASGIAAARYAREMIDAGAISSLYGEVTYEDVIRGVQDDDRVCIEAVKRCAYYISVALRNVLVLLGPQSIYMGGQFVEDCPLVFTKSVEYLERNIYPVGARTVSKSRFTYKDMSAAMGGMALVFDALS